MEFLEVKMRLLFEIDKKDYNPNGTCFIRPSVRGIIIRDGRIAMVHSLKYNYYKFRNTHSLYCCELKREQNKKG